MADIAIGQTGGGRSGGKSPALRSATEAYLAMNRRKRMYSGILLLLFIVTMATGWRI